MRSINTELQTALSKQYNARPIILIKVYWADGDTKVYSTQEVASELGTVYPLVSEFSNFDALTRVDGFGSTKSLTVSFFDQTGHFKDHFDNTDVYNSTCKVYLSAFGTTKYMSLFEGKFTTPVSYDPDTHLLTVTVESEQRETQLCYSPSIDDVDSGDPNYARFEQLFTSQAWPDVFGIQAKMELRPLANDLEIEVAEDLSPAYFLFAHTYQLKVRGDLLPTLADGNYTFNIGATLISGTLVTSGPDRYIEFDNNELTNYWYADKFPITCTFIETIEPDNKIRTSRIRMTGIAEPPWLVGMFVKLVGTITYPTGNTAVNSWVKVIDQTKYAPEDAYETVLTVPAVFLGTATQLEYATMTDKYPKVFNEGDKIIVYNWDKRGIYVVDNKYYADLNDLDLTMWFNNGEGFRKFPDFTYDIYTTNGTDANKLWTGAIDPHPPCTYIQFKPEVFGRMIVQEKNYRSGGEQLDSTVFANVTTPYNSDHKTIENLLERYTTLGFIPDATEKTINFALTEEEDLTTIIPEVAWQKNKAVRETVEGGLFKLELIDLTNLGDPVFTFTADNIHTDPISLYFTPKEDIKTVFKVTIKKNDDSVDLVQMIKKSNTDVYGKTTPHDIEYYAYNGVDTARTDIDYWIDKLSTPYLEAEFTGYLDSIALEVWDVIDVDFGTINFYDPAKGVPYSNNTGLYGSNVVVSGQAVIREMTIDIQTGLIKFKVQFLNKTIGNL